MSGAAKTDKTEKVGITLPIFLVNQTDKTRGDISRSTLFGEPSSNIFEEDDLAYPLPVTIIAELLGVPILDRDLFRRSADRIVSSTGGGI